jgi:hypothetical protein
MQWAQTCAVEALLTGVAGETLVDEILKLNGERYKPSGPFLFVWHS